MNTSAEPTPVQSGYAQKYWQLQDSSNEVQLSDMNASVQQYGAKANGHGGHAAKLGRSPKAKARGKRSKQTDMAFPQMAIKEEKAEHLVTEETGAFPLQTRRYQLPKLKQVDQDHDGHDDGSHADLNKA